MRLFLIPQGQILRRTESQQEGSAGIGALLQRDLCQARIERGQVYFQCHSGSLPIDVSDITGCVLHEGKDGALLTTVTLAPSRGLAHRRCSVTPWRTSP